MTDIKQIIKEEVQSFYEESTNASFPEFGDHLGSISEYGEGNVPPYEYTLDNFSDFEIDYNFDTEDQDEYIVKLRMTDRIKRIWDMQFNAVGQDKSSVLNKGRRDKVMSTVLRITNDFIDKHKPNAIFVKPEQNYENDMRRHHMYMEYIKHNMRPDYFVHEQLPYIIIERKSKITDKNAVTI